MESTGSTHKRLRVYLPNKNLPAATFVPSNKEFKKI
jgi:hypothetical protein